VWPASRCIRLSLSSTRFSPDASPDKYVECSIRTRNFPLGEPCDRSPGEGDPPDVKSRRHMER
jgi:hypothetical protein